METWTGDGGQGKEARTWGIGKTEDGGSYVNLFVKRINAHGEDGEEEEEELRKGMEARDGGRRKPFRNLHAS